MISLRQMKKYGTGIPIFNRSELQDLQLAGWILYDIAR